MTLDTGAITFRPLTTDDLPMLHEWLARPHVAEWWGPSQTMAELEVEYAPSIAGSIRLLCFIARRGGEDIGYIQWYAPADFHHEGWWLDVQDDGMRGIDQFLAHEHQLGRGIGSAMVKAFVDGLFADPAVTRIQTDPSPKNARAIRAYEKAGFYGVGEIDTPDGRALLMHCDRPADVAR